MFKALKRVAIFVIAFTAIVGAAVWFTVRDVVSQLRSDLEASRPVTAVMRGAIIAAEDPVMEGHPRLSLRALLPPAKGRVSCGPSPIAYVLVRSMSPRRRPLRWHIEGTVRTYAVTYLFSPEELLRIYAHRVYLGRHVAGVEVASAAYFGKTASDLTAGEAATLAAMIRSPHYFSPVNHPDRLRERRNRVLDQMFRLGFIDRGELHRAIEEPLS